MDENIGVGSQLAVFDQLPYSIQTSNYFFDSGCEGGKITLDCMKFIPGQSLSYFAILHLLNHSALGFKELGVLIVKSL